MPVFNQCLWHNRKLQLYLDIVTYFMYCTISFFNTCLLLIKRVYLEQSAQYVTSAPSMYVFRGRLKAILFRRSFPWLSTQVLYCLLSDSLSFSDS